jgi:hypothetical protein
MKPGVFPDIPFPSPEFSHPFESVSVPVCTKEFSRLNFFSSREFFQLVCVPVSSPEFFRILEIKYNAFMPYISFIMAKAQSPTSQNRAGTLAG